MKYITLIIVLLVAAGCSKSLTEEEKKVVGSYEGRYTPDSPTVKYVFLKNGTTEFYENGVKAKKGYKWKLVGKEIHQVYPKRGESIYKINPNGDLVWIATIPKGGKRYDIPEQPTFKKLK